MNVKEGLRRLGLVVGVLGASAGAVVAYSQLQPLLTQRGQYENFQALVSSSTVRNEIESLRVGTKAFPKYGGTALPPDVVPVRPADFDVFVALSGSDGWKVNKGGVRAIHFWKGTEETRHSRLAGNVTAADISYIETDDGQEIFRIDPPAFWAYLFIPAFPVLGFLLPWAAIKTLTWIGLGFFTHEAK